MIQYVHDQLVIVDCLSTFCDSLLWTFQMHNPYVRVFIFFIRDSFSCLINFIFQHYYIQWICQTAVSMPVLYCHSSDPYLLPCPQFRKIKCLEYIIVVGLHRLMCSFCSCCIVSFGLTSCQSKLPASLPFNQMELPPIPPVRNVLYTFLKCFIICLIWHCLCFFCYK